MPRIYLCFLWHMHQPFYKNLSSGQYRLPWTRLHALKDYYGMARILGEFPQVRQTFNLVPSMLVQVDEYARGEAADPFLDCALRPAEELTEDQQHFILQYFFQAHPTRMIGRFPRYRELYDVWVGSGRNPVRARRSLTAQAFRDLQVLSQIAWFDEEFLASDLEVVDLLRKGRDFSREDQRAMGNKQREILALVEPVYRRLAASGQIEISTTPFYHPILPLLCDSNIATVAHPNVALPMRFRYPQDARHQLETAREFMTQRFGSPPSGLWPSEGSVSDEVFSIAYDAGFEWAATDSGVLDRTLGHGSGVEGLYRPYQWRQGDRRLKVVFRDHSLSDLIGFVYSRMGAAGAAEDFLHRVRENARPILSAGRDALVPVILDGENAWEYYEQNGRGFLRELYRRIEADPRIAATTVSEALAQMEAQPLDHIFPGSWINANFDVWLGADEDNRSWDYLLRAREAYERATGVPEEKKRLAYDELMIAEGSDWNWWYGPEHDSANRIEFDQLYRDHLANVYRALDLTPPEELSRSILRATAKEFHQLPTGLVLPAIDGHITSYFEWIGAGVYRVDARTGAMHGKRFLVRQLLYGSDGKRLYLCVDFHPGVSEMLVDAEARLSIRDNGSLAVRFQRTGAEFMTSIEGAECAFSRVLEIGLPLAGLKLDAEQSLAFQLSLWQDGLPLDSLPQQGWLEVSAGEPIDWNV